jgi:hypothetical protein
MQLFFEEIFWNALRSAEKEGILILTGNKVTRNVETG